ncbi:MAG: TlpA family protein disulfide reductase [Burkholderiaceae bacterium]|jgi:thiol-disulfide isomerase/thioredoxin|nr:TlpA family protein disulfide reductase [Burkholderiaceae bacterium]
MTDSRPLQRPSRRQLLASAVGLVAGAGLAGCGKSLPNGVDATELAAFWALRLPAVAPVPDGGKVALAAFRGHPLLVNFWATWCPPCVAELPLLSFFYAERGRRDWQCLGLAVEGKREPVARFLAHAPVAYPVALAGVEGAQISRNLGNTEGVLPFTVLFDTNGQITHRKMGQLQSSDLKSWLG